MWRQIRGMGLSYHYSMRCLIEAGYISFNLFRAAQVVQAFEEAKKIMVRTSVSGRSWYCALLCVWVGGGARAFMGNMCGAAASLCAIMTAVFC